MPTKKPSTSNTWTDPDDAPPLTAAWFAGADLRQGDTVIRKGGRPRAAETKQAVNIRLDADLVARLRASGPGWQSRVNDLLRKAVGL